jgi:two-component system, chemotaxis family, protein-glutamate methylesterase/glutaminase
MVRVFAIAYSAEWAACIEQLLSGRDDAQLVKTVLGGDTVLPRLQDVRPDIVVIEGGTDWDGVLCVTKSIMQAQPLPVVILTSSGGVEDAERAAETLEAGALSLLPMTVCDDGTVNVTEAAQLAKNICLLSEVRVVRRWDSSRLEALTRVQHEMTLTGLQQHHVGVVAIGASAGGTKALQELFSILPRSFPLPILVVQHIATGYINGLVRWLSEQTELPVRTATEGTPLQGGTIYLAPDDCHLTVDQKHCILLTDDEPVNGFKPSIGRLFSSVYEAYGGNAVAVLLSGMGNDGAQEMRQLHDAGAITIAQDKATSLIHGIPGEAIKLAAVTSVLPIQEIGPALLALSRRPCQKGLLLNPPPESTDRT